MMRAETLRAAHADAWEVLGRRAGGATGRLPGVRLMVSGLQHPQWNTGDVTDPSVVDVAAVRDWYAARGVPWGLRVPTGVAWPHGTKRTTRRLMGVTADRLVAAPEPDGTTIRRAGPDDLEPVLAIDSVAFAESVDVERPWLQPLLSQPGVIVAVTELHGEPVGTGYCVLSHGDAGPAGYLAGIGVLPDSRRRGVGAALSAWLACQAVDAGAALVHLSPDTDAAASVYRRLGFVETDGVDIYV